MNVIGLANVYSQLLESWKRNLENAKKLQSERPHDLKWREAMCSQFMLLLASKEAKKNKPLTIRHAQSPSHNSILW